MRQLISAMLVCSWVQLAAAAGPIIVDNATVTDALKRNAQVDATQISVEARDSKVILTGFVRSWAERNEAEMAAWRAPGVSEVKNELVVKV